MLKYKHYSKIKQHVYYILMFFKILIYALGFLGLPIKVMPLKL